MSVAVIGGTGLYRLPQLDLQPRRVETVHGPVELMVGERWGRQVVFLARHGGQHETPPHQINYRANIAALKKLGVTAVVATAAVGTLTPRIPPGRLALLTDFIDLVSGRAATFFDHDVIHLDYTRPYCPRLRATLAAAAAELGLELEREATYLCTKGPRFETGAEIRAYRLWGADVVGMTNVPEVVLAREAELCYAAVALATNDAAGVSGHQLTHGEVDAMFTARLADLARLLDRFLADWTDSDCACRHALDEYRARRNDPALAIPM